jgi:ApbE superfamily uncharacterized protein (UPF0280 family)
LAQKKRTYRYIKPPKGWVRFEVIVQETDLSVLSLKPLEKTTRELILQVRGTIEAYIQQFPRFARTLSPWVIDGPTPSVIREMAAAGKNAGVGPMAAVAGLVAETVGKGLLGHSPEVIVENGGDIFICVSQPVTVGIMATHSPDNLKLGMRINPEGQPRGICTSSGTMGHSLSLGTADAVTVISTSCPLADAMATAVANRIQTPKDIRPAIDWAKTIPGVDGVVIIKGKDIAAWGDLDLVPVR